MVSGPGKVASFRPHVTSSYIFPGRGAPSGWVVDLGDYFAPTKSLRPGYW
jgi:hypothetical protein